MQSTDDLYYLLNQAFSADPNYDCEAARSLAENNPAAAAALSNSSKQPTPAQQECYAQCKTTREASWVIAIAEGFPRGVLPYLAAIRAYNDCRTNCDNPTAA